ncbi:trichohyalin-like [Girardinichthys multiradiatus]|uniref:trichohyalin-like n=1 Tax=Girardinichthys multiradiatus TaxID=208333 RepID=UPI001FABBF03|nr:trichohyalin-like [Girardinichthys multiradiatus]
MNYFELNGKPSRMDQTKEKTQHAERKKPLRHETQMPQNPSENQRAGLKNHEQAFSSKRQIILSQCVSHQSKVVPCDLQHKPSKPKNTALEVDRHRENCKKIVYDILVDIGKKEAFKLKQRENNLLRTAEDKELAKKFKEKQMKKKAVAKKPLDDTSACKIGSKKQTEMDIYWIEEQETQILITDNEFELDQDLEKPNNHLLTTLSKHSNQKCVSSITQRETCQPVSEGRKDVKSILGILQSERKNTLPEKDRFRNKCKEIVYDQLTDIKKKEAADKALMEETLVKNMAKKEIALKLRDEMDKEKQAVTKKFLFNAWDAQIQHKQQKKREMAEIERKERQDVIESERLYQIEQNEKRRYKSPNLCEANSNRVSVKDEGYKQLKKAVSPQKQQKIIVQDVFQFEYTNEQNLMQRETCQPVSEGRKGVQSISEFLQNERKNPLPEKVRFRKKCTQIAYDQLTDIKKKEAADKALMEETLVKNMAKQEIALKLRDEMDKEKQAVTKKFLFNTWDAQIQHKQQKKREMAEIERKERQDVIESERLYQIEQNEKRRYKSPNLCEANSNRVSVKDEGDKQLKKAVSPQKQQEIIMQDEFQFEYNTDEQNLMQRETCQPVSEGRKGVQSISEFLQNERKNPLPEKVRFRNKCKEIAYDQLNDIKKKEDADKALMEEALVKNMAEQEIALKLRDKMDKEKQAVTKKFLFNTWDAQIQHKQQKKREMAEIERKERQDVIESTRLYQIEKEKNIQLKRKKQAVYCEAQAALLDARPRRINNLSIIGMNGAFPPLPPLCFSVKSNKDFKTVAPLPKLNTDHNSSLNSQQVNKPVKLPPLNPKPVPSALRKGTINKQP